MWTLVLLNLDIPCFFKQYRSRSVGFWRSQLIWSALFAILYCILRLFQYNNKHKLHQLFFFNMTNMVFDLITTLHAWVFKITGKTCGKMQGSVLETRRSRVQPPPRSATFFHGDWSWNIFYGHFLPSADSRRAVVSFWRKNVHNTG